MHRNIHRRQTCGKFLGIGLPIVFRNSQLLLNHPELLSEKEFSLLVAHLFLNLLINLSLQPHNFEFLGEQHQDLFHARHKRNSLKNLLKFDRIR